MASKLRLVDELLSFELPDLNVGSLDETLEIRTRYGAKEFRKLLREFCLFSGDDVDLESPTALSALHRRWNKVKDDAVDLLATEFRGEISAWQPVKAGGNGLMDLVGFIPPVSIVTGSVAAAKDANPLLKIEQLRHWPDGLQAAFLLTAPAGHNRSCPSSG